MRLNLKPAAALAAASFSLLLFLSTIGPGPGLWLLLLALVLAFAAIALRYRDNIARPPDPYATDGLPLASVGAFGLAGSRMTSTRQASGGVPIAAVIAPVALLALILFGSDALRSDAATPTTSVALQADVSAINRLGEGEPNNQVASEQQVDAANPTVTPPQNSIALADSDSDQTASATTQVRPIVVSAPRPATTSELEAASAQAAPSSLDATEYVVAEGDTLYGIAERYESTVDAILELNRLSEQSFIHPGDTILIPRTAGSTESDEPE